MGVENGKGSRWFWKETGFCLLTFMFTHVTISDGRGLLGPLLVSWFTKSSSSFWSTAAMPEHIRLPGKQMILSTTQAFPTIVYPVWLLVGFLTLKQISWQHPALEVGTAQQAHVCKYNSSPVIAFLFDRFLGILLCLGYVGWMVRPRNRRDSAVCVPGSQVLLNGSNK